MLKRSEENTFPKAWEIYNNKRNALSFENLERLVILHHNLRSNKFKYSNISFVFPVITDCFTFIQAFKTIYFYLYRCKKILICIFYTFFFYFGIFCRHFNIWHK